MPSKFFSATLLSFATASLFAQAPGHMQSVQAGHADIANLTGSLTQNALFTLFGAIALVGMVWIGYIIKACACLNQPQVKARKSVINLLLLAAVLSSFCSSCSVEQRAMAARYRASEAAENRTCPSQHHYVNHVNSPFNNRYPYNGDSNGQGPAFCKHCGQRIFNSKH